MGMCCSGGMNPGAQLRLTQSAHLQRDSSGHHWANARNLLICLCLTFAILLLLIILLINLPLICSHFHSTAYQPKSRVTLKTLQYLLWEYMVNLIQKFWAPNEGKLHREIGLRWEKKYKKKWFHKSGPLNKKGKIVETCAPPTFFCWSRWRWVASTFAWATLSTGAPTRRSTWSIGLGEICLVALDFKIKTCSLGIGQEI